MAGTVPAMRHSHLPLLLLSCSCAVEHHIEDTITGGAEPRCPRVDGSTVDSTDPMFDTTADALLAAAEHTITGPGDTDLVLPDIDDDFSATHSFVFLSAHEAEFEGTGGGSCPGGFGYVIEAEQHVTLSLGNQTVEGMNHVRFFVGEEDPEALSGELVEHLEVDGITQELLDAVADATYGGPRCEPDVYRMGPSPSGDRWSDLRDEAWLALTREHCDEWTTGTVFQGTVARIYLEWQG